MKHYFKMYFGALNLFCLVSNSYAVATTADSPIDFGTIVQTASETVLVMETGGNITIQGGIKSGTASLGQLTSAPDYTSGQFERVENTLVDGGGTENLSGKCTVEVYNVTLLSNSYKEFSLAKSGSVCRTVYGVAGSISTPIKADIRLSGYCPEGEHVISAARVIFEAHTNCRTSGLSQGCYKVSNCSSSSNPVFNIPIQFTITQALDLTETQPLDFGTVISSPAAQTVNMDTNGNRTGGINYNSGLSGQQGKFAVKGRPDTTVHISMDAGATLHNENNQTMRASLIGSAPEIVLQQDGSGTFSVGGILNVAANQPSGEYTGTYTVRISY